MHFRARSYFPAIGRFMQRDPKDRFGQHYLYTSNNPVLMVDPMGLDESIWEFWKRAFRGGVEIRPEVKQKARDAVRTARSIKNNPAAAAGGFGSAIAEGKSSDSLIGFVNGLTEQLNPLGGGIGLDPIFGNFETFEQGVAIGRVTGVAENAVLIALSGPQAMKAFGALKNLPGILKTAKVATNTGKVVETVVVNSQAAAKAVKALRDAGVAGSVLSGQSAAILNAVREGGPESGLEGGGTSGRRGGGRSPVTKSGEQLTKQLKREGAQKGNITKVGGGPERAKDIFRKNVPESSRRLVKDVSGSGRGIAGKLRDGTNIRIRFKPDGAARLQIGSEKFVFEP